MTISVQYNKTAKLALEKQLKVREKALPILKNKESALRMEVKYAKDKVAELDAKLQAEQARYEPMARLWNEFDNTLLRVKEVRLSTKTLAGIKTPVLESVEFETEPFNLFATPVWVPEGLAILRTMALLNIERDVFRQKMTLLEFARKKTTQKVNLYEKVQIPSYQDAIRKIKRFLEDEENLSKSAQKIVKNRHKPTEALS